MILILGHAEDLLVKKVRRSLRTKGAHVRLVDEAALFTKVPFAFRRDERGFRGSLRLGPRDIPFTDVAGVLVRLPRTWWPDDGFELRDQKYVYHETTAAWFSLLSGLPCPVVNRFPLGWWVHDPTYAEPLRRRLAEALGIGAAGCAGPAAHFGRLLPTAAGDEEVTASVYVAGARLVPHSAAARAAARLLGRRADAVARWQEASGVKLCRLDFAPGDVPRLKLVEPFPVMDGAPADVVREVGAATAELFS